MKEKGLTLIEMMAVLVILGILTLILVPMINDIITSSRKKAFKETVNNLLESSRIYEAGYLMDNGQELSYPVTVTCNGEACIDDFGRQIEFKGPVPISGRIILESSELMRADLINNGMFCGSGTRGNIEVHEYCSMLDHTNPLINEDLLDSIITSSTTNSVIVSIPEGLMYDDETGIEKYEIAIYEGDAKIETKTYEDPNVIFENLKSSTEYRIEITGINGNKLRTTTSKFIATLDIVNPIITYSNTPSEPVNGYLITQVLNIEYISTNIENPTYYLKSTRDAKANIIASCGVGDTPDECIEGESTTIDANIWYKVSGNTSVSYDEDATEIASLIALTHDGINYSGASTKTVAMIETTSPSIPTIQGGTGSGVWAKEGKTITLAEGGSALSGIVGYEYYKTSSSTIPNASQTATGTLLESPYSLSISDEGTTYIYYRTKSQLGKVSEWSNQEIVNIDTQSPNIASSTIRQNNSSGTVVSNGTGWRNYNIWWGSFTASDNGSAGINHYEYSTNCTGTVSGTLNNSTGYTYTNGTNYTFCIRAVDNAGNPGAWSGQYYMRVDTQKPVISSATVSGKVATISKSDSGGSGLASYCISTTNSSSGCSWTNNTAASVTYTASAAGTYHAFAKDGAGNISDVKSFTIASSAFCSLTANQQVFAATSAGAYSYTVPAGCGGTYLLQVYGAEGGKVHISNGGAGGYAYGNISLSAGTTIYIYVGAKGPTCGVSTAAYNGGTGGSGSCDFSRTGDEIVGGGGGATHMATTNRGELKNYNSYKGEVIIVAGGGGGGYGYKGWNSDGGYERNTAGGSGGGTSGGTTSYSGAGFGIGGTQQGAGGSGGFGYGSSNGGGGGYYGGGQAGNAGAAGGGGSGYLNTSRLISGTTGMQNGQHTGAGAAYITFKSAN